METVELIRLAAANGIWALLFVCLFLYQLRDSHTRETKYQQTVKSLSESLHVVNDIKNDIDDIKICLNSVIARQKKRNAQEADYEKKTA